MDVKFILICGLLLALLLLESGPARAGDRAQAGSEAARSAERRAAPFSSRAGYVAFWKRFTRAQIAEEEIGGIFAFIPGQYDSSGFRRILLSLFYLGDAPVNIPASWLLELLAGLVDPAEMAPYMDIPKTRQALGISAGLTETEVARAYLERVVRKIGSLEVISSEKGRQRNVELIVRTPGAKRATIPIFFSERKPGPGQLILTIEPGSRVRFRAAVVDPDRQAALNLVNRHSRLLGTPVPAALLQQAPQYFARAASLSPPPLLGQVEGTAVRGTYFRIPFTAEVEQLVIAPGLHYREEESDYQTNAPVFLAVPVTIDLGPFEPRLLKMMLF